MKQLLKNEIFGLNKLNSKNLISLGKKYHNLISKDTPYIVYKQKNPTIVPDLEFVFGQSKYKEFSKLYYQYGAVAHLWMPNLSEKLFFKLGILKTSVYLDTYVYDSFKIPVLIEYFFSNGIVRPKLAYGINLYTSPVLLNPSLETSLKIRLQKNLFLNINGELDFNPSRGLLFLVPNKIFSSSYSLGMQFSFF